MLSQYHEYAKRNRVLEVPPDYDAQRQVAIHGLRVRARPGILVGLLLAATMVPFRLFGLFFSAR